MCITIPITVALVQKNLFLDKNKPIFLRTSKKVIQNLQRIKCVESRVRSKFVVVGKGDGEVNQALHNNKR